MRLGRAVDAAAAAATIVRDELALALLGDPARDDVTSAFYDASSKYAAGSPHDESGLTPFEEAAVAAHFPPPPARLLVGGAGAGRELVALAERGYAVEGYEPVARLVDEARRALAAHGASGEVWRGGHETLGEALRERATPSFDAVVVGWTSWAHLLGSARRVAFLRAVREACPRGPVLLSFFGPGPDEPGSPRERVRARVRRVVAALPGARPVEVGDALHQGRFFVHHVTPGELAREAEAAGYDVVHHADDASTYPHAVLRPRR